MFGLEICSLFRSRGGLLVLFRVQRDKSSTSPARLAAGRGAQTRCTVRGRRLGWFLHECKDLSRSNRSATSPDGTGLFPYEPHVPTFRHLFPHHSQAQLKRHVEPRSPRRQRVQFNARQIVYGVLAALYQFDDPVEPALTAGDFQRYMRFHAECLDSTDVSEVGILKWTVVR